MTEALLWLAVALLLGFLATLPLWSRRLSVYAALNAVLAAYPTLNHRRARAKLVGSRDGLVVLALLCNAAAKRNPSLYRHKLPLLRAVVAASRRGEWWATAHSHPSASTQSNSVLLCVDSTIGPLLDLEGVQLAAHISAKDAARYFADPPAPNGRRWAGVPLQPRAEAIAAAFVARD